MRGRTLLELFDMLRAEAGYSQNVAHNSQHRAVQLERIRTTQQWLWDDFPWPHLRVERFFPVQAGQRFYDPATVTDIDGNAKGDIHIDRIEELQFKYGGDWCRLVPGIGAPQYSSWDSGIDERSWPVERWRIWEDEQIELWPLPADGGNASDKEGYVKIIGIRNLNPLVDDSDRADLDDRLICLFAAADLVSDQKQAAMKLDKANRLYSRLRANLMPRKRRRMFLSGPDEVARQPRGPVRVAYRVVE